ncbi:PI31 proteasome regulator, N-terminal [Cinara cedri]|uniref:Proteasome inhibitor PI31 subunit n=1 Tax=Cinara cedri TaxID=506608 RepID=A0A5E4NRI0_9HEMI|nr:PI31 proteasome regulator, N-terminal [Cinara cedri]
MTENYPKFWSLTFDMFKKDVKKVEDNLIILVHWVMLKNDFQMLGLKNEENESKIDENEEATDNLPPNWSQNITYKFRYIRNKQLFLLNGIKTGDILIFNFYNVMTKKVSSTSFGDINDIVQMMNDMTHNNDEKKKFNVVVDLLEKDLIEPMQLENEEKKVVSTQTDSVDSNLSSIEVSPDLSKYFNRRMGMRNSGSQPYGLPDLDPLGRTFPGSGGMLFDPFRRSRVPRVSPFPARNPLARFDQINPGFGDDYGNRDIRPPYPDHIRPPDFDDDMYM